MEDPNYVAGTNFDTDFKLAFKDHEPLVSVLTTIRDFIFLAGIYFVSKRNQVSPLLYGSFYLLLITYVISTMYFTTCHNPYYLLIQEVIKYLLILLGLVSTFLWVRRYQSGSKVLPVVLSDLSVVQSDLPVKDLPVVLSDLSKDLSVVLSDLPVVLSDLSKDLTSESDIDLIVKV
jgi:hypothetical protein